MTRMVARSAGLLSLVAIATAFSIQPYRLVRFTGRSMEPTYKNGEFAWSVENPTDLKVGDVVVVQMDDGPIVKRIARVPGDHYWEAKMGLAGWLQVSLPPHGLPTPKIARRERIVPAGYVFILGDNLDRSEDSRAFGLVPISHIRSKIINSKPHPLHDYAWLPWIPAVSA